jgi:nucleoside-diphosphate-sugar epimerase
MPKVLITGPGGFTGRHMAANLVAHGYEAVGLFSQPTESRPPEFGPSAVANLLDAGAVQAAVAAVRPEFVIHMAAISYVAHNDADELYRTNIVGTRNLLEALRGLPTPPKMTLLTSSANVYGNSSAEVLDEGTPAAPANDYAVSKLAMEHMARLYMLALPLVLTRTFNYTGVGQSDRFLVPKILDHVRRRAAEIELGNIDVARDFSDVRFVADAYRRLLETPAAAGRTVNVCSGKAYTLRELLAIALDIGGHSMGVRVNPAFVRESEVKVLRGDRGLLQALIGDLHDISLRETLRWMLDALASEHPPVPA